MSAVLILRRVTPLLREGTSSTGELLCYGTSQVILMLSEMNVSREGQDLLALQDGE